MAAGCVICGRSLHDKQRSHAKTCSPRCRKALSRRSARLAPIGAASGELPDRDELLRRLDEQSAGGSTRATLELLRMLPPEEPQQPAVEIGPLISARLRRAK